ncbi:DUF3613 domain-containing protein [Delftia acidovorans]|uniref:DUF3613 domain-containing protein n=1 Tax=Delftia acidovorans TaxID=80866 RepID=UPI0030169BE3
MPDTYRMDPPRRAAVAAAALAPWLLAAGLALLPAAALHAQAFGEVQSPPEPVNARPHVFAEPSTDSILVGYTLYTNPDGTVMYLPRREIDIGGGTLRLLEMQHSQPGQRARPIAGEQARRSYARYLKSFETEIPALYKTGVEAGGRN